MQWPHQLHRLTGSSYSQAFRPNGSTAATAAEKRTLQGGSCACTKEIGILLIKAIGSLRLAARQPFSYNAVEMLPVQACRQRRCEPLRSHKGATAHSPGHCTPSCQPKPTCPGQACIWRYWRYWHRRPTMAPRFCLTRSGPAPPLPSRPAWSTLMVQHGLSVDGTVTLRCIVFNYW